MHSSASNLAAILDADLASSGWDGEINPYPGMSDRQFAMQHLRRGLVKKFHNNEVDDERNKRALDLFIKVNESCANYVTPDLNHSSTMMEVAINEAKAFIDYFCHPSGTDILLSLAKIERFVGFGAGANLGAKSGDPYGKLAISHLTYTDPALLVLFQQMTAERALWLEQEQFRAKNCPTAVVQGSRLSFVPKTSEITRTICTEPILNMFFQKGIAGVIEKRLREVVGIDLSTQPDKNRLLCRLGSETGEFGTIDLSSASDSMSRALVAEWFPDHVVRWLDLTRCKTTRLPNGSSLELHMVSSMGNAFTFPLQTLFFTALVIGAYRTLGIKPVFPKHTVGNFAVFGDDIIVHKDCYNLVCDMLKHCGFTVNYDKSFNTGLFRESCGHDYYHGCNVRAVYIKKLLDDLDFYSAYNRLARWSVRHRIPLVQTLEYLAKGAKELLFVPLHEDDEAGFKVPLCYVRHVLKRNYKLQSYTYRIRRRKPLVFTVPTSECDTKALNRLKKSIPGWFYSPAGLYLLILHGSIRDGRIVMRLVTNTIETCKRNSSCWNGSDYDTAEMLWLWGLTTLVLPAPKSGRKTV